MGYWDGLVQNKNTANQSLSVVRATPVASVKVVPVNNNQQVVVEKRIARPGDKDFIGPVDPRPKLATATPATTATVAPAKPLRVAPVSPQGTITVGGKSQFQTPTAPVQQTNIASQDIIPAAGDAETKMRQASLPVEGALPSPTSKGDGFWAGLIKSPVKALVVRPAVQAVQAVIAPSQISASGANSQRRDELSAMQNKLALAFRAESNPAKRNRLATQIAENQKVLDQAGAESEIIQKTIDKLYNDTTVDVPAFGDFTVAGQKSGREGVKQIAGDTLESASYIYAGQGLTNIGAKLVKGAVAKAALSSGAIGTVGGGAFGLAQSLQENAGVKETLINTAVSAAVGGAGGAALGAGVALTAKGVSKAITLYGAQKESLIKAYVAQGYSPAKAKMMAEQGGFVRIQSDITGVDKAVDEQGRVMAIAFKNNATGKPEILFNKQAGKSKLEEAAIERGFISTVKGSPNTAPQVSSKVTGAYTALSNQQTAGEALRIVNNNPDVAYRIATQTRPTAKSFAVAQQLITKYQREGNFEQAINLTEIVAKKATQSGQAIQALSMYNRLTPEGVLRFAQKEFTKSGDRIRPGGSDKVSGIIDDITSDFRQVHTGAIDTIINETPGLGRKLKPGYLKPSTDLEKMIAGRILPPEEELASRISPFLKAKHPNPIKEMVSTLYKLASEQLPAKKRAVPKDSITLIGQALRDKNAYKDVWLKAQDIVRERYKNRPQAIQLLDKYFDKTLLSGKTVHADLPVAQSQINTAVKQGIKTEEIDLGKLVRQYYTENKQAGQNLTNILVKKANVPFKEAVALSKRIQDRFNDLTVAKKESILNQLLKDNKINIPKTQAQKIIEMSNLGGFDRQSLIPAISKKLGIPYLDEDLAKRLIKQSNLIQRLPEGRTKIVETARLLSMIADKIPTSKGRKLSTIQTMAQLLNPKTFVRNVVGNTSFAALENVSDVVGTPIDKAVSLFTGKRTKGLPSLSIQARGFKKGLKEGVEDALLGINTSGDAGAKFDLPHSKVFKGKILGSAEKLLNLSLRAPDRAGYEAVFQNSIANQMKFAKVANPTDEMIHIANLDGLYRTFNDDSVAAQAFSKIKNALNTLSSPITGKDWGIGDAVLKYPKTPGNLLARGVDYSPAGFLKSVTQLARPLVGKEFNQKAFVESTSRALVGSTGLVGTGAILHKLGIITGKPEKDADMNALQRATGLGQYKMNVSALKRFVFSGFDPSEAKLKEGDKLLSYDWMQPLAIGLAIGANIDDTMSQKGSQEDKAMSFVGSLIVAMGEGVDTLGEQPLVQGITRPFKYATSIGDAALQTLKSVPASFIPSLLSQIRYIVDPSQRNVNDPDMLKETMKLAQNRIPGLSKLLPQKYSGLGEPLRYEQGPISTLVNPAIMSKYVVSPEQKMVFDIFNRSGEKTQVPRLIPKTEKVNGQSIQLTGEQQSQMQQIMGQQVKEAFARAAANKKFLAMTDEDKAKTLAGIMTDVHTAVKYEILGHRPSRLSDRAKFYVKQIRKVSPDQATPESESSSKTTSPEAEGATKTNYWSGLVQP